MNNIHVNVIFDRTEASGIFRSYNNKHISYMELSNVIIIFNLVYCVIFEYLDLLAQVYDLSVVAQPMIVFNIDRSIDSADYNKNKTHMKVVKTRKVANQKKKQILYK